MILHGPEMTEADAAPARRSAPTRSSTSAPGPPTTAATLLIRPIRPEDEPLLVKFHETLSERSVSLRYFHAMKLSTRVAHERLTRICFIDYDREMALVAEAPGPAHRRAARSSASAG